MKGLILIAVSVFVFGCAPRVHAADLTETCVSGTITFAGWVQIAKTISTKEEFLGMTAQVILEHKMSADDASAYQEMAVAAWTRRKDNAHDLGMEFFKGCMGTRT